MSVRASLAGVLALACAALAFVTPPRAGAEPGSLAFAACAPTQVVVPASGLQCATLQVPFDRSNPALGTIALAVQRVPASAPRIGTIVLLAGRSWAAGAARLRVVPRAARPQTGAARL